MLFLTTTGSVTSVGTVYHTTVVRLAYIHVENILMRITFNIDKTTHGQAAFPQSPPKAQAALSFMSNGVTAFK